MSAADAPPASYEALCERIVQQQEVLADCLAWLADPDGELRVTFPPPVLADSPGPWTVSDKLALAVLERRAQRFLQDMAACGMAGRRAGELFLNAKGDVLDADYAVEDAWRGMRLSARWLVLEHGDEMQRTRLESVRDLFPDKPALRANADHRPLLERLGDRMQAWRQSRGDRPAILLVEDDVDAREGFEAYLRARHPGIDVVTAANGKAAIQALPQRHYDAVLCDLRLPDLDGIALLRMARTVQPGTKRYLMTSYVAQEIEVRARAAGVHGVLRKPLGDEQLRSMLPVTVRAA
ncbi:MAG: hypothetical protein QOD77_1282 [Thermoplasmata archaeon]|nr:hypothetical protein [Thermoplasmata archaeon]